MNEDKQCPECRKCNKKPLTEDEIQGDELCEDCFEEVYAEEIGYCDGVCDL